MDDHQLYLPQLYKKYAKLKKIKPFMSNEITSNNNTTTTANIYQINNLTIIPLFHQRQYSQAYQLSKQTIENYCQEANKKLYANQSLFIGNDNGWKYAKQSEMKEARGRSLFNQTKSRQNSYNSEEYQLAILYYNNAVAAYQYTIFHNARIDKKIQAIQSLNSCLNNFDIILTASTKSQIPNINNNNLTEQDTILYSIQMIKIAFQFCVVLSQIGQHSHSEQVGIIIIKCLNKIFGTMMEVIIRLEQQLPKLQHKKTYKQVDFKMIVIKQAKSKILQLMEYSKIMDAIIFMKSSSLQEGRQYYQQQLSQQKKLKEIIQGLYSWKSNTENNEKFMKLKLKIQQQQQQQQNSCRNRNILGISQTPIWIQQFNIGQLMIMQPKTIQKDLNNDPFYLLSTNKILQLSILYSVGLFTISTEIRFQKNQKQKQYSQSQKHLQMISDPQIFKSIQIGEKFIPNARKYIKHLISSFNKNYKKYMEKIEEDGNQQLCSSLQSLQSLETDRRKQKRKQQSEQEISTFNYKPYMYSPSSHENYSNNMSKQSKTQALTNAKSMSKCSKNSKSKNKNKRNSSKSRDNKNKYLKNTSKSIKSKQILGKQRKSSKKIGYIMRDFDKNQKKIKRSKSKSKPKKSLKAIQSSTNLNFYPSKNN